MKNINLISIGIITTLFIILFNQPGQANPHSSSENQKTPLTVNETIDEAFFQHSNTVFGISTISGQLNDFFGWADFVEGSYPENQVRRDALLINTLHQDLWKTQGQSTETLRSKDLPNPYRCSIQTGVDCQ